MAFVSTRPEDEEAQKAPTLSSGGLIGNEGLGQPLTEISPNQPTSGTGYTNIQDYLNANKDATKGLSEKVAGVVTGAANTAKSKVDEARTAASGAVSAATPTYNQDLVKSAISNPLDFSANEENVKNLTALRDATYKGPTSFETTEGYQPALSSIMKAEEKGTLAQTPGGYEELVKEVNPSTYKAGKSALNQQLLQASPEAQQTIGESAESTKTLKDYLAQSGQIVAPEIAAAKKANEDVSSRVKGELETGIIDFEKLLENRAAQQRTQEENYVNMAKAFLSPQSLMASSIATPKEVEALSTRLGITPAQVATIIAKAKEARPSPLAVRFGGVDPLSLQDYLTIRPETAITGQNVATADDLARYQALNSLAGLSRGYLDESQLGRAPDLVDLDYKGAIDYLNALIAAKPKPEPNVPPPPGGWPINDPSVDPVIDIPPINPTDIPLDLDY